MKYDTCEDDMKLANLRQAIDEGDSSGIARGDVFARVRKAIQREANRTIADAADDLSSS